MREDTVAAIATPYGVGGVAVIRVSGPEAIAIGDSVFRPQNKRPLSAQDTGRLVYGEILRGDAVSPTHMNPVITSKLISTLNASNIL